MVIEWYLFSILSCLMYMSALSTNCEFVRFLKCLIECKGAVAMFAQQRQEVTLIVLFGMIYGSEALFILPYCALLEITSSVN